MGDDRDWGTWPDGPGLRELVEILQRDGPLTADAIAGRLGASRTAVARHLRTLADRGVVSRREVRHGVGRPRHLYDVTEAAYTSSPSADRDLVMGLLEAARRVGGEELVARLFEARRQAELMAIRDELNARIAPTASLPLRARHVAAALDQRGHLVTMREDGGLRILLHACPFFEIAQRTPIMCEAELRMIGEALGALAERETNLALGAHACSYRIRARGGPAAPGTWSAAQMRNDRVGGPALAPEPPPQWTSGQMVSGAPAGPRRPEVPVTLRRLGGDPPRHPGRS